MAKKKRRYIGPTKEAVTQGLAKASEGVYSDSSGKTYAADTGKRYTGPVSQPAPAPQKPSIGLGASRATGLPAEGVQPVNPEPLDIQILQEDQDSALRSAFAAGATGNLADYGTPQNETEARARAIILGYYKVTHRYPSPDKVMMLMQSPIQGDDPKVYERAWSGAGQLPDELSRSDILQDSGYENLHGVDDLISTIREKEMGAEYSLPGGGPLAVDTLKDNLRYLKGMKTRYNRTVHDIMNEASPADEVRAYSDGLAQRLRRRGAPVLWDTDAPSGDKDFIKASTKYAVGRQWAFSLWGSNTEKKTALETIEYLRTLPLTKSQQQKLGESLGIPGAQWGDQNTIGTVLDAMRYSDDDFVHELVYDGWMFGRPIGQSASQARAEYASRFGIQRLPSAERQKYEQSNQTLMGTMQNVTNYADKVWEQAKDVPGVGHYVLAPLGWFAGNTFKAFNYPIEAAMQALVTCYDIANRADRNMTLAEYHDYLAKGGKDDEFGWNWSVFTDTAAWASAWEESEGKTPISEFMKTVSLDLTGKETPFANAIGQMSDFALMMYVGAKMDPVVRGAVKGTYVNAVFPAGRGLEKYIASARLRYGGEAAQTGEWMFKIEKSDLDRLQPHVRAEVKKLADEYRELELEAQGTHVPSATENAEITRRIRELGGIAADAESNPYWDTGISYKENQTAFRNLAKRKGGEPMDELAATLAEEFPGAGISDAESLWSWLNRPKEKVGTGAAQSKRSAELTARASEIEGRVAYALSNNRLPEEEGLMNAPEGMFDRSEVIGEGQQAGLDIGVDTTAGYTEPFAKPPVKGPEQMPGQRSINDYAIGERFTDANGNIKEVIEFRNGKPVVRVLGREMNTQSLRAGDAKSFDEANGWQQDNPGPEYVKDNPTAVTGYYKGANGDHVLQLDPKRLLELEGERGERTGRWEQHKDVAGRIEYIRKVFKEAGGKWPEEFADNPITVNVYADGRALIYEGNKRLMVAAENGLTEVPVEWRFLGGSEARAGVAHPADFAPRRVGEAPTPEMPGQTGMEVPGEAPKGGTAPSGYKVGDKVRFKNPDEYAAPGKLEQSDVIVGEETLPDGSVEYKLQNGGYISARDIIGPERRSVPREPSLYDVSGAQGTTIGGQQRWMLSKPRVNENGVTVRDITSPSGETFYADADIADDILWSNEHGYPTHQSHGFPESHPRLHDSQKVAAEPYIEYVIRDLDTSAKLRSAKIGHITEAAKGAAKVERGTAQVETLEGLKYVPTIKVKGDVHKFIENLKNRDLGERPGARMFAEGELSGRGTAGGPPLPTSRPTGYVPQPETPLANAIFRTNAEVISQVDDPSVIGFLYDVPENDLAIKTILYKLAETKNVNETYSLLRELESHGIDIDGGAAAVAKNMRQAAYRKGFAYRSPLRFFITPQTYGKAHPVDGSSDMTFNVAAAVKMGRETMDESTWARVRQYRRRMWEADRPMEKQNVLNEMWAEIEKNMGPEKWQKFQKYKRMWYWAAGKVALSAARRAYLSEMGQTKEASLASSKKRTYTMLEKQLKQAEAELDSILKGKGDLVSVAERDAAVKAARQRLEQHADAWDVIDDLGMKDELTTAEQAKLDKAIASLDRTPVPFKMGQAKNHLVHAENPRILSWYQSGPAGQAWGLVDQAIADPLMTIFKETVMSAIGFPLRVNVGDEMVRLIPEGTAKRMLRGHVKGMKRQLKEEGLVGDELKAELHDRLAYDWAAQDMGDWVMVTKQTHPRYFAYLKADLDSWKREPIVQRIVAENGGVFPSDVEGVHAFIARMAREDSEVGQQMRQFLMDTYRYEGGTIDGAQFREWTNLWEERLQHIASHEVLRRAMTKDVTPSELASLPDDALWPVNAPAEAIKGYNMSPATVIRAVGKANPFHWIYQGIPVPKSGGVRIGTVQMLGGISNWMRDTVFADRYYMEREAALKRNPKIDPTELHDIASERAYRYTNRVTYSKSATVAEDMMRNLLPFVNAYRQFWAYWGKTFLKHPISISVARENYPLKDQFAGMGDLQMFLPSVPFWGINASEDPEDQHGIIGFAKGQLPQASFLLTGPARTVAGALQTDPESLVDLPFLSGMSSTRAPFSRQGRLLYGLTGFNSWDDLPSGEFLFGDPDRLEKAHVNAVIGQLTYDNDGTDPTVSRNKPAWWRAEETLFHYLGLGRLDSRLKPEALFAEVVGKQIFPVTTTYSPQLVRERANLLYQYYDAEKKGDTVKAASLRAESQWLDTDLRYYDASAEEKNAMEHDPANAEHLKFWVSPYNYEKNGNPMNGYDWKMQFTLRQVSWKDEEQIIAGIHNMYTDIYGGTYVSSVGSQMTQRVGGTKWLGDVPLEKAQKNAKAKLREANTWAKRTAKELCAKYGWEKSMEETLMYQFQHPSENWGIWPQIIKSRNLDPVAYNVDAIAEILNKHPKQSANYLSGEDALRLLDLSRFIVSPSIRTLMLTETPFKNDLTKSQAEQRDEIIKAAVQAVGTENWYFLGSQQMQTVGIKSDPKLDLIQLQLRDEYEKWHKYTAGSSEYKEARQAYYKRREKLLKDIPGGPLIYGGTAERIMALPYAMDAQVTSMGTGKRAAELQAGYDNFVKVRDRELKLSDPDSDHIRIAWDRFVANRGYEDPQAKELTRVAAWALMLSEAKHLRYEMMNHYSDYYEGKGDSSSSKYGLQRVASLNKSVERLRKWSPEFGAQLNSWFDISDGESVGNRFLDWYNF